MSQLHHRQIAENLEQLVDFLTQPYHDPRLGHPFGN